jgi:hypothetical protein
MKIAKELTDRKKGRGKSLRLYRCLSGPGAF